MAFTQRTVECYLSLGHMWEEGNEGTIIKSSLYRVGLIKYIISVFKR